VQPDDELLVTLSGTQITSNIKEQAIVASKRLLGIDADLSAFYRFARSDKRVAPLAQRGF